MCLYEYKIFVVSQRRGIQSMAGDSKHSREEMFLMQSDDVKGNLRQLQSESFHNSHFLSHMKGAIKI